MRKERGEDVHDRADEEQMGGLMDRGGGRKAPVSIAPGRFGGIARSAPPTHVAGAPTPSDKAAERLARTLHERTTTYRADATIDLTLVDALLRTEGPAAASEALDEHALSLDALVAGLHAAVAEATVEREAEAVLDSVLEESGTGTAQRLMQRVRAHAFGVLGAMTLLAAVVMAPYRVAEPRWALRVRKAGPETD